MLANIFTEEFISDIFIAVISIFGMLWEAIREQFYMEFLTSRLVVFGLISLICLCFGIGMRKSTKNKIYDVITLIGAISSLVTLYVGVN